MKKQRLLSTSVNDPAVSTSQQLPRGKSSRFMAGGLQRRAGKIKYGCLAWLIGLPLPIVILLMFYKGCDF